jgi:PTS system nitrogen regulatory IIA component
MRVTVREAAALLSASEEQMYDWIESNDLPAYKINDQYQINRSELLEWATSRKIAVAPELFREAEDEEPVPGISNCLRHGGVFHGIAGTNREEILRNVIEILRVGDESEREMLLQMFLARETLGSTSVGDGIAIPHVRNPIVLSTDEPLLTLCFIEPTSEFGSLDGKPIHALFVLVCPTIHIHLQMLARLAHLLRIPEFREKIRAQATEQEIIAVAAGLEDQS